MPYITKVNKLIVWNWKLKPNRDLLWDEMSYSMKTKSIVKVIEGNSNQTLVCTFHF